MNGLSLCAGVGGLDLGIELAFPEYRCIAAIENNPEAAKRFRLRFPQAKVFRDCVGFDARPLNGIVDCVSAGWPCQPHSVAGKRLGTSDERWIWSDIARITKECGASFFFGENVSGLLRDANVPDDGGTLDDGPEGVMGGMGTVLRDLAEMGFIAVWGSLRASNVGASHGRPRVFILGYKPGGRFGDDGRAWLESGYPAQCGDGLADSSGPGFAGPQSNELPGSESIDQRGATAELHRTLLAETLGYASGRGRGLSGRKPEFTDFELEAFAPGPSDSAWPSILGARPYLAPALSPVTASLAISLSQGGLDLQAEIESGFCGLADGVASWLVERRSRLQCGGNGVVPLQAAVVYAVLASRLKTLLGF